MKYYILILALIIGSCSHSPKKRSAQELLSLLNNAYEQNSMQKYEEFLNLWKQEIIPIKKEELNKLSVKERNIYQLFKDIYNPKEYYERDKRYKYDYYSSAKYLVLQNKVYYYQTAGDADTSLLVSRLMGKVKITNEDSLTNFRPAINYNKDKILFLNDKYENILNKFLFGNLSDTSGFKRDEYLNDSASTEIDNKVDFLNKKIHLEYNHWSISFWYFTFPSIDFLTISNNYRKAIVEKRNTYASGNEIEYHLIKNHWIKKLSISDWEE